MTDQLQTKVEGLINAAMYFTSASQSHDDSLSMFSRQLPNFLLFLRSEYFPRIASFRNQSLTYKFESPLNFLMLRSDLKEFLESFFQVESMIKYALRFHIQSMFTIPYQLDR